MPGYVVIASSGRRATGQGFLNSVEFGLSPSLSELKLSGAKLHYSPRRRGRPMSTDAAGRGLVRRLNDKQDACCLVV